MKRRRKRMKTMVENLLRLALKPMPPLPSPLRAQLLRGPMQQRNLKPRKLKLRSPMSRSLR
jgi:hypothetical protein